MTFSTWPPSSEPPRRELTITVHDIYDVYMICDIYVYLYFIQLYYINCAL